MALSFFFYDLETSGLSPSRARVMQFAGQRTDSNLKPVGEPVNLLIKLAPDVLPDPDAILLTGITPQSTLQEGLTEAEFLTYFYEHVVTPDTIFLGYNTVRFDDEFMRFMHYRNFYDPYEWQWANGCSRWDLLDVVRMTRALRPDGIEWPITSEGKPTNKLELLTKANGLLHDQAHDALSDVVATIAIAKLIKDKQPDLFAFLLEHRSKKSVSELLVNGQPFVYTTGKYPAANLHTSAAVLLARHPLRDCIIYDLRYDPSPFMAMTPAQLVDAWGYKKDRADTDIRLPVKTLKCNRCPTVAPLGVMKDPATQERLGITMAVITQNLTLLKAGQTAFTKNILAAVQLMDEARAAQYPNKAPSAATVDDMLYDGGFIGDDDKQIMRAVHTSSPSTLDNTAIKFSDQRLQALLPLYKARNHPAMLSAEERQTWEQHVAQQIFDGGHNSQLSRYFARLQELAAGTLTSDQEYLIEELQLYGESVMPSDADLSESSEE